MRWTAMVMLNRLEPTSPLEQHKCLRHVNFEKTDKRHRLSGVAIFPNATKGLKLFLGTRLLFQISIGMEELKPLPESKSNEQCYKESSFIKKSKPCMNFLHFHKAQIKK